MIATENLLSWPGPLPLTLATACQIADTRSVPAIPGIEKGKQEGGTTEPQWLFVAETPKPIFDSVPVLKKDPRVWLQPPEMRWKTLASWTPNLMGLGVGMASRGHRGRSNKIAASRGRTLQSWLSQPRVSDPAK